MPPPAATPDRESGREEVPVIATHEERADPDDAVEPTDESFESALPVDPSQFVSAEPEEPAAAPDVATARPSVETIAEKVPVATRALLTELFKAEITTVRRIPRDQWR